MNRTREASSLAAFLALLVLVVVAAFGLLAGVLVFSLRSRRDRWAAGRRS
jgi:hypothetical protein